MITFARANFTRQSYEPEPGHHRADEGASWCRNDDPHPVGLCRTDVGQLVTDALDFQVSIENGRPCIGVAFTGVEDVLEIDAEQARLVASWLNRAADLSESQQSGATT